MEQVLRLMFEQKGGPTRCQLPVLHSHGWEREQMLRVLETQAQNLLRHSGPAVGGPQIGTVLVPVWTEHSGLSLGSHLEILLDRLANRNWTNQWLPSRLTTHSRVRSQMSGEIPMD